MGDAIAIMTGLFAAFLVQQATRPMPLPVEPATIVLASVPGPAWIAALMLQRLYVARVIERQCDEIRRLVVSGATAIATVLMAAVLFGNPLVSRLWVLTLFSFVTVALVIERHIARQLFTRMRRSGRLSRRVAIIGVDEKAVALARTVMGNAELGYEVTGFIGDGVPDRRSGAPVIGCLEDSAATLREHGCSGAIISLGSIDSRRINQLTRALTDDGFHVALSTSLRDIDVTRMRPQTIDGENLI